VIALAACGSSTTTTPPSTQTATASAGSSPTGTAATSEDPSPSPDATDVTPTPADTGASPPPATECSGSDANRVFFSKAAASMTWSVYCAVLPANWFLERGTYGLAAGGELEVSYNGPGDIQVGLIEGNACAQYGSDIDACAPRDTVIDTAQLADQTGELGRLASAFVLDVDRGANPGWRVTGIGMSQADFVAICAAMLRVGPTN
jgi:hypothetical protein